MSAYIVENKTINEVLSWLYLDRDNEWMRRKIKNSTSFDIKNELDIDKLGRAMLLLNVLAVNQRYQEDNNSTPLLRDYDFMLELNTTRLQALKSLQCWLYQCSEGNVPDSELYKLFDYHVKTSWLEAIVDKMPEYEKARW